MQRLNNSYQIPPLVRDSARTERRWPDSGVCNHLLLMKKRDASCFRLGKSQVADLGHVPTPGTSPVGDTWPPPLGTSPIMTGHTRDTAQQREWVIYSNVQ